MSLEIFPTYPRIRADQVEGLYFVSPMDYGARGDGINDDWNALLKAMQRAQTTSFRVVDGGGRVYRITSAPAEPNTFPDGIRLRNMHLVVDRPGALFLDGCTDLVFEDVTFDFANIGYGLRTGGVRMQRLHFRRCVIKNVASTPGWLVGSAIAQYIGVDDFLFADCVAVSPRGVSVTDGGTYRILDSYIEATSDNAFSGRFFNTGAKRVEVRGCTLIGERMGAEIWGGGAPRNSVKQVVFERCTIRSGSLPDAYGLSIVIGAQATVRDCEITSTGAYGIEAGTNYTLIHGCRVKGSPENGIASGESDYLSIEGCVIEGAQKGIRLENDGDAHYFTVMGNVILEPTLIGISDDSVGRANGGRIIGNAIVRTGNGTGTWHGISLASQTPALIVMGNTVRFSGSGYSNAIGIRVNSTTPLILQGNIVDAPTPILFNSGASSRDPSMILGLLSYATLPNEESKGLRILQSPNAFPYLALPVYSTTSLPSEAVSGTIALVSNPAAGKSHVVYKKGTTWYYADGTPV